MDVNKDFFSLAFGEDVVGEDREKEKAKNLETTKNEPEGASRFFEREVIAKHNDNNGDVEGGKEDRSPELKSDIAGDGEGEVAGVTSGNPVVAKDDDLRERKNQRGEAEGEGRGF